MVSSSYVSHHYSSRLYVPQYLNKATENDLQIVDILIQVEFKNFINYDK